MDERGRVLKIKRKHERKWLRIDGVTAIGIGMDNDCTAIIVSYSGNPDVIKKVIPASVDKVPVIFKYSGTINAQDNHFTL
jgi:hypothetical protein